MTERPIAGRPRLLVLTSTYPRWRDDPEPGFVHELARRLTEDFDVTVLGPHAAGAATHETMDGVNVLRFRYAPAKLETLVNDGGIASNLRKSPWKWLLVPMFLAAQTAATYRAARRLDPNLIHAHWLIPQGFVAAIAGGARRPYMVTSHGADLFAMRRWPLPAIKRWIARRASAISVVSDAMAEEFNRLGFPIEQLTVQPMGVDLTSSFIPDPGQPRSNYEILFVGRLVEKKGLRHLIGVMPQVIAQHPEACLTIVGFGPEDAALRAQTASLGLIGHVRFLGAVPHRDLPALYRRAALFVAPFVEAASGDQEGLGLVVVEAIGCGCPALVGDVAATRDLPVERVRTNSKEVLAQRVSALLAASPDDRAELARRAREALLARLDWDQVARGYAETLKRAMGGREQLR